MRAISGFRSFTGWHMTMILVAFFAIVIAVNILMATYAIGTFGGTVVENSYVASQNYNGWLRAADRQDALGWKVDAYLDDSRHVSIVATKQGIRLDGVSVTATARHPLGRAPDIDMPFAKNSEGTFSSRNTLPKGRWQLHIVVRKDASVFKSMENIE